MRVTVALQEQDRAMPVLLVLSGPPGIGKSTLGDAVVGLRPAVRLSIDDVEEAMLACGVAAADTGVAAYEVVRAAAEQNLALGSDVVVDAVNDSDPARTTWSRAADATGAVLLMAVLGIGDPAVHRARLEGRARPFVQIAEPTWEEVLRRQKAAATWGDGVLHLDAAQPAAVLAQALLVELASR
jgi:predicted kinase